MAVQTAVKAPAKDRKTIKEHVTSFTVKQALNFVDIEADSPDKTFEKLLGWAEKFDDGTVTRQLNAFKKTYEDPDSNWYQLIRNIWDDVDPSIRKKFFRI